MFVLFRLFVMISVGVVTQKIIITHIPQNTFLKNDAVIYSREKVLITLVAFMLLCDMAEAQCLIITIKNINLRLQPHTNTSP